MSDTVVRSRSSGGASPAARAMSGSTAFTAAGISRSGAISARNASDCSRRGESSFEEQVPHVFDRALLGELDRVVLAVVVEAFEAAHVADRRLGDDDALEPAGDVVREVLCRLDLRDAHEVAHRHQADEPLAVDHRDVAVAVLGQAGERDGGVEVGRDAVGFGGHPGAHRVDGGIGAGRRQSHEVALGEDADGALAVDHHDRTDALLPHPRRRLVATVSDSDAVTTGRLMISETNTARPSCRRSPRALTIFLLTSTRTLCETPNSVR